MLIYSRGWLGRVFTQDLKRGPRLRCFALEVAAGIGLRQEELTENRPGMLENDPECQKKGLYFTADLGLVAKIAL